MRAVAALNQLRLKASGGWRSELDAPAPERHVRVSRRILGLALLALLLAVRLADPWPVAALRYALFDLYQRMAPRPAPADPVLIVDIDEASLAAHGQWPWPRSVLATLVERLVDAGAAAIALDINFAEPDRLSPPRLAETLPGLDEVSRAALRGLPSNDALLAAALARGPVVLAEAVLAQAPAVPEAPAAGRRAAIATLGPDPGAFLPPSPGVLPSIPELASAASGIGINSFSVDRDGVLRSLPLLFDVGGRLQPALALELLRVTRGADALVVRTDSSGIRSVALDELVIPTDAAGHIWLYFSEPVPDRSVSAAAVLAGEVAAAQVAGRAVLIGTSAVGLKDLRATPIAGALPGVEILAQAVEAMRSGDGLQRPPAVLLVELATLVLVGLAIVLVVPRLGAFANIALSLVLAVVLVSGSWLAFAAAGLLVDWTYPVLAGTVINVLLVFIRYAEERRARRAAHQRLLLVQQEMAAARRVQSAILPTRFPAHRDLELYAATSPAREVGGDFYDYLELPGGRLGVVVADVSGKGMSAALFMAVARTLLRAYAASEADPGACLTRVNQTLAEDNDACMFVTVFYGVLERGSGALVYANGGHNEPYLVHADGAVATLPGTGGVALGLLPGMSFTTRTVVLGPGDAILLYTDGVTEAIDGAGEEFSDERLARLLERRAAQTARDAVEHVVEQVGAFIGQAPQADDITCLALRYLGAPADRERHAPARGPAAAAGVPAAQDA